MSRGSTRQAAVLGLFTAGGVIIATAGIIAIGNLSDGLSRKIEAHTTFDDSNGLTRGAAVWFSGVPVGTVRELTLTAPEQVDVTLAINPQHAAVIPADASAYISSDSFIGNTIVILVGGTPGGSGLPDGATLSADETLTAEQVISEVRATNNQIQAIAADLKVVTGRLAEGEGTAGKLLADDSLYASLSDTVSELQRTAQNSTAATRELASLSRSLNQEGGLPRQLASDETTYPALVSSVESLQQTATSIAAATDDPDTPLGVMMHSQPGAEDLEGTLDNLHDSSALLEETLDTLQHSWWLRRLARKRDKADSE